MKLLLDQGLPRSTVKHLVALGIVAEHVGDLGMASASDNTILDAARHRQAVVVTLDWSSRSTPTFITCWQLHAPRRHPSCGFGSKV